MWDKECSTGALKWSLLWGTAAAAVWRRWWRETLRRWDNRRNLCRLAQLIITFSWGWRWAVPWWAVVSAIATFTTATAAADWTRTRTWAWFRWTQTGQISQLSSIAFAHLWVDTEISGSAALIIFLIVLFFTADAAAVAISTSSLLPVSVGSCTANWLRAAVNQRSFAWGGRLVGETRMKGGVGEIFVLLIAGRHHRLLNVTTFTREHFWRAVLLVLLLLLLLLSSILLHQKAHWLGDGSGWGGSGGGSSSSRSSRREERSRRDMTRREEIVNGERIAGTFAVHCQRADLSVAEAISHRTSAIQTVWPSAIEVVGRSGSHCHSHRSMVKVVMKWHRRWWWSSTTSSSPSLPVAVMTASVVTVVTAHWTAKGLLEHLRADVGAQCLRKLAQQFCATAAD